MKFNYKNALLVDDSITLRTLLITHLKNLGMVKYTEAANGEEATKVFFDQHAEPFDVIFTDWKMPILNGVDFIINIRKSQNIETQPKIFVVTSEGEKDSVLKALDAGADGYILKPFTAESIKKALQNIATLK